jgi:hypothetical protein
VPASLRRSLAAVKYEFDNAGAHAMLRSEKHLCMNVS